MSLLSRCLPRSLVGRVFALYTVTLVGFVLAGLGLFYYYQLSVALEHEQVRTDALSSVIAPTVSDSAVIGDYDTILKTLERTVDHSDLASASFIDMNNGLVTAPRTGVVDIKPPQWLIGRVAERLYDSNTSIKAGGRDYGVLRLRFDAEVIAGRLWAQMRFALLLALFSIIGGLLLIRYPLVRWLGNLSRIQAFEHAMQTGDASPAMLAAAAQAPSEFRETFEVLGRAAASLQSQRAQAAVTLEAIADGVFSLDAEGLVVLTNPAAQEMLGGVYGTVLGRPVAQVLPEIVPHQGPLQPWSGRRSTLLTEDGSREVVLDTTLSPIRSPNGDTVGYVLACRDVSQQHALDQRLHAELQSRESAMVSLRQVLEDLTSEVANSHNSAAVTDNLEAISSMISTLVARLQIRSEQLNAIFALSPDGFVSFDANRCANYISPGFTRLTGIAESQVLGATEAEIEGLLQRQCDSHSPWRSFATIRHERSLAPSASASASAERRELIELVRPTGRVLELGLRESHSGVISQVLSLRDVTHETEVDQMKSEFLTTAAHELRTPMTSIFGFMELMLHREMPPEKYRKIVQTIHRQAELMIAIINELLDLSRIEARRGKDFSLETMNLCELVEAVLAGFKPPQERPLPSLPADFGPVMVYVDRQKMSQAFLNVLSNAYKYSPDGGEVSVEIVRSQDASAHMVGLQVRDQGIGMTPAQLARVSERFYRADASGTIPGTGLGMSIVKEIIELLGGHLELVSQAGAGSTVTLWLPLAPEATPS